MSARNPEELIHAALDGELDERGQRQLDTLLAGSPEARALHKDMQQLNRVLADVPDVDPPAGLRDRILHSIPVPGTPTAAMSGTEHGGFPYRMAAGLAIAFAAGALVSAGLFKADQGAASLDPEKLVGTMARIEADTRVPAVIIDGKHVSGQVSRSRSNGVTVAVFRFVARGRFQLDISPADGTLEFRGFARQDQVTILVETGQDLIRLEGENSAHFSLALGANPSARLNYSLRVGDDNVYEGVIDAVQ